MIERDFADAELKPFGWAPGFYTIACFDCHCSPLDAMGAKLCSRCLPCAVAAKLRADMELEAERREQTHE